MTRRGGGKETTQPTGVWSEGMLCKQRVTEDIGGRTERGRSARGEERQGGR
jgi:hypothetical protein